MSLPYDIPTIAKRLDFISAIKNLTNLHQLHAHSLKIGLSHSDFVRSKLVSSYASCGQTLDAHFIFSLSSRKPTFVYNTLIRSFNSINQFTSSLSIFRQLLISGKVIDRNTLPTVLKSVAGISNLRLGRRVHGAVVVNGFGFDLAHCNALVTMYGKCGDLGCARKVFDEMPHRNRVSWCSMMGVYGVHGRFEEVFGLFERMLDLGVEPDEATFTTVLTACSHGGFIEKGEEYFGMMTKRFELRPTMEHYTCMVDMLGRGGRIEDAKNVIEDMEIEPDEALWRALFGSCKIKDRRRQ